MRHTVLWSILATDNREVFLQAKKSHPEHEAQAGLVDATIVAAKVLATNGTGNGSRQAGGSAALVVLHILQLGADDEVQSDCYVRCPVVASHLFVKVLIKSCTATYKSSGQLAPEYILQATGVVCEIGC